MNEKVRLDFYLSPKEKNEIDRRYKEDGSKSRNAFVRRAVRFYLDYLSVGRAELVVKEGIQASLEGIIGAYEHRLSALLFKQSVEHEMMLRICCDCVELDDEYLQTTRAKSIKSVKLMNGQLRLEQVNKKDE